MFTIILVLIIGAILVVGWIAELQPNWLLVWSIYIPLLVAETVLYAGH